MNAPAMAPEPAATRAIGDVVLDVKNISLRFGGVRALTDISFDVREPARMSSPMSWSTGA